MDILGERTTNSTQISFAEKYNDGMHTLPYPATPIAVGDNTAPRGAIQDISSLETTAIITILKAASISHPSNITVLAGSFVSSSTSTSSFTTGIAFASTPGRWQKNKCP